VQESIEFLKELQKELINQEYDCQATPRFWTVGDYKMVPCREGCHDEHHVYSAEKECSVELNALLEEIESDAEYDELSDNAKKELKDIGCEVTALDWLEKYYAEDVKIIPVREEHFIRQNTMFLTKAEAKKHIELNHYHYSDKAHTYAMTAWRAPKVERLLKILETFDWDSIQDISEIKKKVDEKE